MTKDCIVGLDIGTTKVCAIVGEVDRDGALRIVGVGHSPSKGIRKGVVVDIDESANAIIDAVGKVRRSTEYEINTVVAGITGEHIASLNSKGVVAITGSNHEITEDDVARAQDKARVIVLPPDREIIHFLPRSYTVDGQSGIRNPVGMSGLRLEVEMHIVTGAVTFIENVVRSVHKAGLTIDATVLEPIATGEAVLLPAERDMGVALADIGGGTTDVAIFVDGDVVYSSVIPVGGTHVTRDISIGLRCDPEEAERVKVLYGTCLVETVGSPQSDHFEMCCLGETAGRQIPRRILAEIVYPRMEELYEMVSAEIDKSGYHNLLPAGIVLSGGGSQIAGGTQLCQRVTGLPTRIGMPRDVSGLTEVLRSPVYATGVGLALYGARHSRVIPSREQSSEASAISVPAPITPLPPLGNFMKSLQQFFARFTGGSK